MHGLINRSIQCFIRDTYGPQVWAEVAQASGFGVEGFESMLSYDDSTTLTLLSEAAGRLAKPEDMLLEDIGTYLVSHPNTESIRRLLRFGGDSFYDLLHSLDDLPDRARLAVADLEMPELELVDGAEGEFALTVRARQGGFACVLVGILRALADDYGALAFLDLARVSDVESRISINVVDNAFAEGRSFSLARPAMAGTGTTQ